VTLLGVALGVLLAASSASTQLYFEQTTVTTVPGEVAGPGVQTRVWHSGRRMRLEAGGAPGGPALLLRLDRGQAYRLDPERHLAIQLDTERLRARAQMDASVAGALMGGSEEGSARTKPLPGLRTIAGRSCRGFRISGPSVAMDVWVTDALPFGVEAFTELIEWSGASQSLGGLLTELRRLPGFPLQTRAKVSVLGEPRETLSTVTKILVGPQPASLFELPLGWLVVLEESGPESP
jgi:Domain of unknown function (DUF4412)